MGCICSNSDRSLNDPKGKAVLRREGSFTYFLYGKGQPDDFIVGEGCRRAPAWSTPFTEQQTQFKVEEFWESRRRGNPDAWRTLRLALDTTSPEESMLIATTSGLTLTEGLLSRCTDDDGFVYELPAFLLNPALEYGKQASKPPQPSATAIAEMIEIRCRSTQFGDHDIKANTMESVEAFKTKLAHQYQLTLRQVRVFFNGREMKDEFVLLQYGVKDKNTVTVVTLPKA